MSSALERRHGLTLTLNLTGWFAMSFLVVTITMFLASYYLVRESLAEDWHFTLAKVSETAAETHEGHLYQVWVTEEYGQAVPDEAFRESVEHHFIRTFLILAAPLLLIGILGGAVLTYYATRPGRRVVATVQDILRTGDLNRRVSLHGIRRDMQPVIVLFNQMLEHNESLVRASHQTLDNVAHDLRTPLTRLRATAERAVAHPDDGEATREALADCIEETDRLVTMVNTIMDVAEAETGSMRLERQDVSVPEAVREVAELYELVAEERRMHLDTELPDELNVNADPARLRQALANLVDNALKYSDDGGSVAIRAHAEGGDAVITVTDRGRGIPKDDLPHIWKRLFRGDRSRAERGLGLGLSFVRAIVEAHGGTVDVESTVNEGSTFVVRMPATAPPR